VISCCFLSSFVAQRLAIYTPGSAMPARKIAQSFGINPMQAILPLNMGAVFSGPVQSTGAKVPANP
jgi:hypothetical protein